MNEIALEGTVDGEAVSIRLASNGHAWVNLTDNGDRENAYADIYGPDGLEPVVHLEWDRTIANDQTTDAFGYVDIPEASGALHVGNCEDDGFVSFITAREGGADFLLRDLRAGPPCQGQPVEGELAGCFRFDSNF